MGYFPRTDGFHEEKPALFLSENPDYFELKIKQLTYMYEIRLQVIVVLGVSVHIKDGKFW